MKKKVMQIVPNLFSIMHRFSLVNFSFNVLIYIMFVFSYNLLHLDVYHFLRLSVDDAVARSLFMSAVLHYIFVPVGLHDTKREFVCQYKVAVGGKLTKLKHWCT